MTETTREGAPGPLPVVHDWKGKYTCPVCGEAFRYHYDLNVERADDIPHDLKIQVVHDHEGETPEWWLYAYRHRKGGRYPASAKGLQLLVEDQHHSARQARLDGRWSA